MAAASVTVTLTQPPDFTNRSVIIKGTIAIGASPGTYSAGGLTLSFANLGDLASDSVPSWVSIVSGPAAGSTATSSYKYQFAYGTTLANGTIQIFQSAGSAAPDVELANNASIPAGVSGDTITFRAEFPKLL